ncbi:MAG: restriction endonuclease subunit S, partial [Bacteroidota bacterium]
QVRQSVLAAAFRGDLTAAWRAAHPDTEPASVLLDRIRAERRHRWIEATAQTKTERAASRATKKGQPWDDAAFAARLAKERTKAEQTYAPPAPVEASDLPELPKGWCWTNVDEVSVRVSVGHVGKTTSHYCETGGIPFLRSQNVRPGYLDLENIRQITTSFHEYLSKSQLLPYDLLVVRVGANRGDTWYVPEGIGPLNCANIVFARPVLHLANFIAQYCQSPQGRSRLLGYSRGGAQGVINTSSVAELPIPLPPLAEQARIVELVSAALEDIAALEATVEEQRAALATLHQATLAKAFRGELVPTDAALACERGELVATPDVPEPAEREEAPPPIVFEKDAAGRFVRVDAAGQTRLDL